LRAALEGEQCQKERVRALDLAGSALSCARLSLPARAKRLTRCVRILALAASSSRASRPRRLAHARAGSPPTRLGTPARRHSALCASMLAWPHKRKMTSSSAPSCMGEGKHRAAAELGRPRNGAGARALICRRSVNGRSRAAHARDATCSCAAWRAQMCGRRGARLAPFVPPSCAILVRCSLMTACRFPREAKAAVPCPGKLLCKREVDREQPSRPLGPLKSAFPSRPLRSPSASSSPLARACALLLAQVRTESRLEQLRRCTKARRRALCSSIVRFVSARRAPSTPDPAARETIVVPVRTLVLCAASIDSAVLHTRGAMKAGAGTSGLSARVGGAGARKRASASVARSSLFVRVARHKRTLHAPLSPLLIDERPSVRLSKRPQLGVALTLSFSSSRVAPSLSPSLAALSYSCLLSQGA